MNTKMKSQSIRYLNGVKTFLAGRTLGNESGAALVIALLLMVAIITIIPVAMHLTSADLNRTKNFENDREAFFIADAGLQMANSIYQNNVSNDILKGLDNKFSTPDNATKPTDWSDGGPGTEIDDNGTFEDTGATVTDSDGTIIPDPRMIPGGVQKQTVSKIDGNTHWYTQASLNGGNYRVRIYDNDDEGLCPLDKSVSPAVPYCSPANLDPLLDEDNEKWVDHDGLVHVESIGTTASGDSVTLHGLIKQKMIQPSRLPAAVVLVGPKASVQGGTATYKVTGSKTVGGAGYDIGSTGTADAECAGKGGISIEGKGLTPLPDANYTDYDQTLTNATDLKNCELDPPPPGDYADVCIAFTTVARKNVTGYSKDGSTTGPDIRINDQTFTAKDAAKMYKDIITDGKGYYKLPNPANPSDIPFSGTEKNPVILWAPGDLTLAPADSASGYGILVVDGNLKLSGKLEWSGIIMIGTCPTCVDTSSPPDPLATGDLSGTGTFLLNGSMIIGNGSSDDRSRSAFTGTADFQYSCKGLAIASNAFGDSFGVVSWNKVQ